MRSGWNTCKASIFSPLEMNLRGLLTTERIEMAAPPRVSPSSLVRTTPSKSSRSLNSRASVHGVLTRHGVDDEQRLRRFHGGLDGRDLLHHRLVHARRPAVSTITTL